jgi:hypothetical protein
MIRMKMGAAKWRESTNIHEQLVAQAEKQKREEKEKRLRAEARERLGFDKKIP